MTLESQWFKPLVESTKKDNQEKGIPLDAMEPGKEIYLKILMSLLEYLHRTLIEGQEYTRHVIFGLGWIRGDSLRHLKY